MHKIFLSIILISLCNCVSNIAYYDDKVAQEGGIHTYNPPSNDRTEEVQDFVPVEDDVTTEDGAVEEVVVPIEDDVTTEDEAVEEVVVPIEDDVATEDEAVEEVVDEPSYKGTARLDLSRQIDRDILGLLNEHYADDGYRHCGTIAFEQDMRDFLADLSATERENFLAIYYLASDLYLWSLPSIANEYARISGYGVNYDDINNRLPALKENFEGYFGEMFLAGQDSYTSSTQVQCLYHKIMEN